MVSFRDRNFHPKKKVAQQKKKQAKGREISRNPILFSCIPGTLNNHLFNGCKWWSPTIFYVMIWFIIQLKQPYKNWLFGVPGLSCFFIICLKFNSSLSELPDLKAPKKYRSHPVFSWWIGGNPLTPVGFQRPSAGVDKLTYLGSVRWLPRKLNAFVTWKRDHFKRKAFSIWWMNYHFRQKEFTLPRNFHVQCCFGRYIILRPPWYCWWNKPSQVPEYKPKVNKRINYPITGA